MKRSRLAAFSPASNPGTTTTASPGDQKAVTDSREQVREMLQSLVRERPDLGVALTRDTWGPDRAWMVGCVRGTKEVGLPVKSWTHKYLTSLSLGPWRTPQQLKQKNALLRAVGEFEFSSLDAEAVAGLPFRLSWQYKHATALHSSLRHLGLTLDELCERLIELAGPDALDLLSRLSDVRKRRKCLAFFVREALELDAVPVDRHVRKILERFGLEDTGHRELVEHIRLEGYDPRLVARALYEQGLS